MCPGNSPVELQPRGWVHVASTRAREPEIRNTGIPLRRAGWRDLEPSGGIMLRGRAAPQTPHATKPLPGPHHAVLFIFRRSHAFTAMNCLRAASRGVLRAVAPAGRAVASCRTVTAATRHSTSSHNAFRAVAPVVASAGVAACVLYNLGAAQAASVDYKQVSPALVTPPRPTVTRHGSQRLMANACLRHRFELPSPISWSQKRTTTTGASAPCSCAWHGTRPAHGTCTQKPAVATGPPCASSQSAITRPTQVRSPPVVA